MDPATLFESNLDVIDRVIAGVCRRARINAADAEDFAYNVRGEGQDVELLHGIRVTPRGQTEPHRR